MASSTMRVVPTVAVLGLRSVSVGEKGVSSSSELSEAVVRGKTCRRFSSVAVGGGAVGGGAVVGSVSLKTVVVEEKGPLEMGVEVVALLFVVLLLLPPPLLPFEDLFSEASVVF